MGAPPVGKPPRRRKAKQAATFSPPACHAGRSRQPGRPRFSRQVAIGQTESGRHRSRAHGRSAVDRNHSRGGASDPESLTPACALRLRAAAALVPPARPDSSPPLPPSSRLQISLSLSSFYSTYSILFTSLLPKAGCGGVTASDPRRRSLVSRDRAALRRRRLLVNFSLPVLAD